jgi:lysophospholipase L1-like esterase
MESLGCLLVLRLALGLFVVLVSGCSLFRPATTTPMSPLPQWQGLHRQYVDRAAQGGIQVLFLGDSITMQWSKSPLWASELVPLGAENFGVDGDGTRQVLWRVTNSELNGISPRVVVLLIGINDVLDGDSPEAVRDGTLAVIREIQSRLPQTRILSVAIFPVGRHQVPQRTAAARVNELVTQAAPPSVRRVDIGSGFVDADGTIAEDIEPDGLHLGVRGYEIWAAGLLPVLQQLLATP